MSKKKTILIFIICIVILGISIIIYNVLNPKITKESVISDFNKSKEHFNIVKDYLSTKEDNYHVNRKSYEADIKDENVKRSIKFIFDKMKYERIYKATVKTSTYIIFIRGGNDNDEFGVIFTENKVYKYGLVMDYIKDDWYFHWRGYSKVKK